ncbi:MAG: sulfurtransferase [Actinobacteria bacterium]|nr:MAG: sulfurtransferase [Actinomycetota bacterium]
MALQTEIGTGPLIDTDALAASLNDPSIAVIEVDEDTTLFEKGHIPGAASLDWKKELHALPRRDFVSAHELAALLGSKGVSSDQTIVFYGGNNNWFAAYAYWLCKLRGIENVKLLDGGRTKWELEDRPMTELTSDVQPAKFEIQGPERPELRAFRDDMVEFATTGGEMVDVRSPGEFSGEVMAPEHLPQEQPYVAGHVPGAANIPWSQAANEDGTFKSVEELRSLYGGKGISGDNKVIAYCRIGERSSHTWFVLSELLGFDDVANYDGSWTEYGSSVGVPVEVGA